jgi:TonB family protein
MEIQNHFKNYVAISIAAHLLLVAFLYTATKFQKTDISPALVEINFLSQEELLEKMKTPDPKLIVETDSKTANEQLNEKTKYLSEKSNSVVEETKAKTGKQFLNSQQISSYQAIPEQKNQPVAKPVPAKAAQAQPQIFDNSFDAYASLNKAQERKTLPAPQQKNNRSLASTQNSQASITNDHLDGVKDDLMTKLNTREYKYYGYYNRIKNQLNDWWVPQVQQKFTKMMKQGRTIASSENKITKLIIVLNSAGNLVKVQVMGESGVRDLDDAAVEAFRQAAPFPNPPKGMMEMDGTVKIRWDCVVES